MANVTVVDEWSGEAKLDDMSADEERAYIQKCLDHVDRHGTVSHAEAMHRIDALRERLRSR